MFYVIDFLKNNPTWCSLIVCIREATFNWLKMYSGQMAKISVIKPKQFWFFFFCCFVKKLLWPWFTIIVIFTASGECCSRIRHICRDAPRPEETSQHSERFHRAGLLPFLLLCLLVILHTGRCCARCPGIVPVFKHPRAQAWLLLLQWCCGTRRCKETTQITSIHSTK